MRRGVTPLAVLVSSDDPARLRTALGLAAAQAALGGRASLFFDALAVPVLGRCEQVRSDDLPSLAALLDTCLDMNVAVTVCQTGLAAAGLRAEDLDPRLTFGGMIGLLSVLPDARLVIA
ncbi:DsrE family protein [uncultured Sphingomonas sp.]|uniref:DsrE family protein n=1 Tax=uncultured Sphingomonas sp. TaxID=158754 RepID=UPI0025E01E97|nr:DsrE family protein [uncultured Sphingomonas sp.]